MRYDITHMLQKYDIHNNYELPRLVSFPRTGSHWFRYIMEITIGMPAIVSSYYFPNPDKCWGLHIHDRWLDNQDVPPTRDLHKVIYLFRGGRDTIYSMLRYDKTIPNDWNGDPNKLIDKEVREVTSQYKSHLERWRFKREDIKECLEIRYEDMMNNAVLTFEKTFDFLSMEYSREKLNFAIQEATKDKIDALIIDSHAMDKHSAYNPEKHKNLKNTFNEIYGSYIDSQVGELLR